MPQCALARRTPSIGGRSGKHSGASGETLSAMAAPPNAVRCLLAELVRRGRGRERRRRGRPTAETAARNRERRRGWLRLLLGLRCRLRRRCVRGERLPVLIEELDLRLARQFFQLCRDDLLRHLLRDLGRDLLISPGLALPLVLDLDD